MTQPPSSVEADVWRYALVEVLPEGKKKNSTTDYLMLLKLGRWSVESVELLSV